MAWPASARRPRTYSRPNRICISRFSETLLFESWSWPACDSPSEQLLGSGARAARERPPLRGGSVFVEGDEPIMADMDSAAFVGSPGSPTCNLQLATCNLQLTTCNMQLNRLNGAEPVGSSDIYWLDLQSMALSVLYYCHGLIETHRLIVQCRCSERGQVMAFQICAGISDQ